MTDFDPVERPEHYASGPIECIDAIHAALGDDGFVAYCRGTAMKYAWRAGKKEKHAEDLRKGAWYLNKAAEVLGEAEANVTGLGCDHHWLGNMIDGSMFCSICRAEQNA